MRRTDGYFTGGGPSNTEELLPGVYNPSQKRQEVMSRLQASFAKIRDMDFSKDPDDTQTSWLGIGRGRGRKSQPEDVVQMSLMSLESEISELQKEVDKYTGPHFTRAYRTNQGLCAKLQTDLNALDVTGRGDLLKKRKEELMRIDGLAKQLASKAHPDGKSCADCEVKD